MDHRSPAPRSWPSPFLSVFGVLGLFSRSLARPARADADGTDGRTQWDSKASTGGVLRGRKPAQGNQVAPGRQPRRASSGAPLWCQKHRRRLSSPRARHRGGNGEQGGESEVSAPHELAGDRSASRPRSCHDVASVHIIRRHGLERFRDGFDGFGRRKRVSSVPMGRRLFRSTITCPVAFDGRIGVTGHRLPHVLLSSDRDRPPRPGGGRCRSR